LRARNGSLRPCQGALVFRRWVERARGAQRSHGAGLEGIPAMTACRAGAVHGPEAIAPHSGQPVRPGRSWRRCPLAKPARAVCSKAAGRCGSPPGGTSPGPPIAAAARSTKGALARRGWVSSLRGAATPGFAGCGRCTHQSRSKIEAWRGAQGTRPAGAETRLPGSGSRTSRSSGRARIAVLQGGAAGSPASTSSTALRNGGSPADTPPAPCGTGRTQRSFQQRGLGPPIQDSSS